MHPLPARLRQVVYEWARGTPFQEICQLTDVMEGSIVRAIVRLDETCRRALRTLRPLCMLRMLRRGLCDTGAGGSFLMQGPACGEAGAGAGAGGSRSVSTVCRVLSEPPAHLTPSGAIAPRAGCHEARCKARCNIERAVLRLLAAGSSATPRA